MLFTLEALEAKFGDCLLLHYGPAADPFRILIDGGPHGVYEETLKPRLEELRTASGDDAAQLFIDLLMISHVDRDHIVGILDLMQDFRGKEADGDPVPYRIVELWHNSFSDAIAGAGAADFSADISPLGAGIEDAAVSDVDSASHVSRSSALVLASIMQGRRLRKDAEFFRLAVNTGFAEGLIVAGESEGLVKTRDGGLELTILGPRKKRVDRLRKEWKEVLEEKGIVSPAAWNALAADFLDRSVPNLSSIVVLAELGGKTMLLTGDARGDDILKGLGDAGLLEDGKFKVDLFKLPHHGSDRNVSTDFFRAVTADHYVISADGHHGNPDLATLQMLSTARGDDRFTIYFTNKVDGLPEFFDAEKAAGKSYSVVFREDPVRSLVVNLGDEPLA